MCRAPVGFEALENAIFYKLQFFALVKVAIFPLAEPRDKWTMLGEGGKGKGGTQKWGMLRGGKKMHCVITNLAYRPK